MKTIKTCIILLIAVLGLVGCGGDNGGTQTPEDPLKGESNVLVVYFSWSSSNNTKTMATYISEETNGELFRLIPSVPYTTDYDEVLDVAQEEKNDDARPELQYTLTQEQLDMYDVIFIGYPIWWGDAPMIVYTFLESLDFSSKTIIPFATSGGSSFSGSDRKIARICAGATMKDGLLLSGSSITSSRSRVNSWIEDLEITNKGE